MINLLLSEDKQRIQYEYRRRLAIACSVAAGSVLAWSVLVIGSVYVTQLMERKALQASLSTRKESGSKSAQYDAIQASVDRISRQEKALSAPRPGLPRLSPVIETVSRLLPSGIRLSNMEIDSSGRILVRGLSTHRAAIISFTEALKADNSFSSVDSPFSNLLKDSASDFTITLSLSATSSTSSVQKVVPVSTHELQ